MAWRERSVSPVGASRFEQPYTPKSSLASPASATTNFSKIGYSQQFGRPSMSRWSASESQGYSTAPSSVYHAAEPEMTTTPTEPMQTMCQAVDHDGFCDHNHENEDEHAPEEWYTDFAEDGLEPDHLSDDCPDGATLAATYDIPVYTADGVAISFGSLHDPDTALNQRQLIIFIRHFFCGACQAYVKAISEGICLQEYFAIPIPTSIIVIGCGQPHLIPFYREVTGTAFPIFAEPSRKLYKKLQMVLSVKIGKGRPDYMRDISAPAWLAGQVKTIRQGLRARQDWKKLASARAGFDMVSVPPSTPTTIDQSSEDEEHSFERREMQLAMLKRNEALARARSLRRRDIVRGGHPFQIGGEASALQYQNTAC